MRLLLDDQAIHGGVEILFGKRARDGKIAEVTELRSGGDHTLPSSLRMRQVPVPLSVHESRVGWCPMRG